MLAAALFVIGAAASFLALLWALQRRLVYLPFPADVPPVAAVLPGAREIVLRTDDGLDLGAWFLESREPRAAVLVAPGNAGNRSLRAPLAAALARRGLAVLLFDYRGYGGNCGRPTQAGLARDVRAALRYLRDEAGYPLDRIMYFGESLGSAVATELATTDPPAALVLRSPFTDLASVGHVHYPFLPVRLLLRDRYPLAEQIARVEVPTTVVYGQDDGIVPPAQSRAVAAAAPGIVRVVEVAWADHNDRALLDGAELIDAVAELAERSGLPARSTSG
jgi:fermentation-respiration switch protein FrsA (DUF1100 family)